MLRKKRSLKCSFEGRDQRYPSGLAFCLLGNQNQGRRRRRAGTGQPSPDGGTGATVALAPIGRKVAPAK
jgi:hypothetical protein